MFYNQFSNIFEVMESKSCERESSVSLRDQARNDMKEAMRAKDQERLTAIRLLLAAFQDEESHKRLQALNTLVETRGVELRDIPEAELPTPEPLTDAELQQVVAREIKKRQDSAESYTKAGRQELAAVEERAIPLLQGYLPQQMSPAEARSRIEQIISEVGGGRKMTSGDMKQVMPVVMERLRGQADGRMLNQLVRELLNS